MFALSLTDQCDQSEDICNRVYDWTGNRTAATLADWLIGKPLAIAGLVGLALVLRFVFHRLVDRLVVRAEDGVLPDRMSRFSRGADGPPTCPTPRRPATWRRRPGASSAPRPWATCSRASSPACWSPSSAR